MYTETGHILILMLYFDALVQERCNPIANALDLYFFLHQAIDLFLENIKIYLYLVLFFNTKVVMADGILLSWKTTTFRQASDISGTIAGNKIVDHSDVVGALPVGTAPTTSSFST